MGAGLTPRPPDFLMLPRIFLHYWALHSMLSPYIITRLRCVCSQQHPGPGQMEPVSDARCPGAGHRKLSVCPLIAIK